MNLLACTELIYNLWNNDYLNFTFLNPHPKLAQYK